MKTIYLDILTFIFLGVSGIIRSSYASVSHSTTLNVLERGKLRERAIGLPHPTIPKPDMDTSVPVFHKNGTELPPYNRTYYFNQLIDHKNPDLGTFKQRYWYTVEFYERKGPVILMTPGEDNAEEYVGYLTNLTINGQIAQQENGTTVLLEHRFLGYSNPINDLSEESLELLTVEQAILDFKYFVENVNLIMPNGEKLDTKEVPWILLGGSYSGALTSWTMVNQPNLFWGGYASSGVVEAIQYFWAYFDAAKDSMPRNCSIDVQSVIEYVDNVYFGDDQSEIEIVKQNFNLTTLEHYDDVAGSLRLNLWDWQSLDVSSGPGTPFYNFCDALEVKDGISANASGWGLEHAFGAWGNYWNNSYIPALCGDSGKEDCLGTYNMSSSTFTNTSVNNANRSWNWLICTQFGWFQDGAPEPISSIASRIILPEYDLRQCKNFFPKTFADSKTPTIEEINRKYLGWDVDVNRLFFANGQRDPWRPATVSSDFHYRNSTDRQPISVSDGFHCSDLLTINGEVDITILEVQQQALLYMRKWVEEWKYEKMKATSTGNFATFKQGLYDGAQASLKYATTCIAGIGRFLLF